MARADDDQPRYFGYTGDGVAKDFEFGAQFIQTMRNIIDSKNPEVIGTLFQPDFVIVGCNGTYSKEKLIQYLVLIHLASHHSYNHCQTCFQQNGTKTAICSYHKLQKDSC
ncbi:hypothetical protein GCK72_023113 [Caenorhabditis remanei]|uniref:NTF2-like domain-containing protein n=1 Tax=Caenorhabditis remanei TaxID=31234 RepID=A0A6A5FVS5_CAERE|nr:hypothetical protein GCK72_023113 [Caenorhabditis remanei]KAF1746656.1 hypothetical protein GCK72_023113 [Caenorhabditis remanei]